MGQNGRAGEMWMTIQYRLTEGEISCWMATSLEIIGDDQQGDSDGLRLNEVSVL